MTWVLFKDRCSWYLEFKSPKLTVSHDPTVTEIHADHMPVTFGNVDVVHACNVVVVEAAWPKPRSSSDSGPGKTPRIPSYEYNGQYNNVKNEFKDIRIKNNFKGNQM